MSESGPIAAATIEVTTSLDPVCAEHARAVLLGALAPEERDDRFDAWPVAGDPPRPGRFAAALASVDGQPVGFLGGDAPEDRFQLDAIVAPPPTADDRWCAALLETMFDAVFDAVLDQIDASVDDGASVDNDVEVWAKPARPWHEQLAAERSMRDFRALHQMRCELPVDAEPVPTRAYTNDDFEALLSVNNRAFAHHPDQGAQTPESLGASIAEPWFRPEGVRLYERDGRLAGFCWTKIHPSPPAATELGEIYVIGVDPDFHGQGLGVPMTAAGLSWLSAQDIETGMLYVEADNVPAIKTYERLGFSVLRTDRAWRWSPPSR